MAAMLLGIMAGCNRWTTQRMQGAVAEYEGVVLMERDLRPLTKGLTAEDSVRAAEQYIRQWCVNLQMEENIKRKTEIGKLKTENGKLRWEVDGDKVEEIERLVADYRRSLYEYEWERGMVAREMSQLVEDSVVVAYYEAHKNKFILRETILRGVLLVVPNGAPNLEKIKGILKGGNGKVKTEIDEEVLEMLEKYAYQYASGYELFLDEWKTSSQVLLRMPFEEDNLHKLLKQKRQLSMQDSLNTYVLQVSEMYGRGEQMPLDYARGEIEKILLNQRQVEFIQQKRDELYTNALKQGKLKLYEK